MSPPPAVVGMALADVDTPALVIDLAAYERNLDIMATRTKSAGVKLRAHAKTHKSPIIALHQMARGAVGVCCQKVSEADILVHGGVRDVMVSNEIVGESKLNRLAALARMAKVSVCIDDANNAIDLAGAATQFGVVINTFVETDIGAHRCGVAPGLATVALAKSIADTPGLRFAGLHAYHGRAQHIYDLDARRTALEQSLHLTRQTVAALAAAGLTCETVTGGGTGTWELEAAAGVYNEVQAGSYVFMDVDYRRVAGQLQEFEHALFVLATVMSKPMPGRAVLDAGLKAFAVDSGLPVVKDRPDIEYVGASDEHGTLKLHSPKDSMKLGDKLLVIPGHCDPTVNLHDWYVGIRDDRVEAVWPVAARGAGF